MKSGPVQDANLASGRDIQRRAHQQRLRIRCIGKAVRVRCIGKPEGFVGRLQKSPWEGFVSAKPREGEHRQNGVQRFEADKKDDVTRNVVAWNQKADSNEKGKLGAKVIFI